MTTVILLALPPSALWGLTLYLRPFGRCPKCHGKGHIQRGPRRRPVCPRCKGRRRVQRRGSRTIHRLAFKIRDGQGTAARCQRKGQLTCLAIFPSTTAVVAVSAR